MPTYKATHIPYGIADNTKRTIVNPGLKDEATFNKYGIETAGEYFEIRGLVKPGGGVPIHRHYGYGETFYPIQGEIAVVGHNGTKTMRLKDKNDTYSVVPGEWHRFWNPSDKEDIVFDAKVFPAHQGFEKTLHIFYGLAADGHGTPDGLPKSFFYQLMLADMGKVGYPGFVGFVMGLLARVVGLIAKVTGEEERLTRKYYGLPIEQDDRIKWKVA